MDGSGLARPHMRAVPAAPPGSTAPAPGLGARVVPIRLHIRACGSSRFTWRWARRHVEGLRAVLSGAPATKASTAFITRTASASTLSTSKPNGGPHLSRPQIQQFAGAIADTVAGTAFSSPRSTASSEAPAYIGNVDTRIVLIRGETLRNSVRARCRRAATSVSELKRLDSSFSEEEWWAERTTIPLMREWSTRRARQSSGASGGGESHPGCGFCARYGLEAAELACAVFPTGVIRGAP
jgi:hypothetical protein